MLDVNFNSKVTSETPLSSWRNKRKPLASENLLHVEGDGPGSGTNVNKAQIMDHIISDIKRKVNEYNELGLAAML